MRETQSDIGTGYQAAAIIALLISWTAHRLWPKLNVCVALELIKDLILFS